MKKILILTIMLLSALSVSARVVSASRDTQGVKFGVRGSFALSNMNQDVMQYGYGFAYQDGVVYTRLLPGFAAGFALDFPIVESFHLNVELKYVMKGQKTTVDLESKPLKNDFIHYERLSYLELPVQPQFRLIFTPKVHMNLNVGPYLAVALHGTFDNVACYEGEGDAIVRFYPITNDESKMANWDGSGQNKDLPYSRFDTGFSFGLDLAIDRFHVGTSFDLGLRDIMTLSFNGRTPDVMNAIYDEVKNRTWSFTLGWDF